MLQLVSRILLAFALITFMIGCRTGKNYQRPEVLLPTQFNTPTFSDTSTIADIAWKQFFKDEQLLTLIDSGIQYNHNLLIAIKRIDIAQQQVRQSKMLYLPEINAGVTSQYSRPSDNSLNGLSISNFLKTNHVENFQAFISLSWEVDIWGKIRRQQESALAQYLQSNEAAKAIQTQLVASIAQGYFNLTALDRQLAITRKNLALSDSFVTATRLLRDAGLVNSLAVQQAQSQKQNAAILLPQLEEEIALQENALQILTGHLPGKIARSATTTAAFSQQQFATGLPIALLSRRPDVREQELELIIANARIGIAQANMYPALNITAGGGLESFKASNWFNIPNSLFGFAAGAIAQPIFQHRELKTAFEISKLQRDQAVTRFRQSVLIATTEVTNALIQAEKLKEQQVIAISQTDTLQKAVANAQLLFKSDLANYLEVLTAQSNALQAELNLATIERRQLNTVVELYRSLGGGWK
ncbi:MAG: efflux transporter outer membrane subunit [Chitinophagaceae bacterium]|nr:efflux transporter outer membrane subunit [Chitinophagaceae bacterium]